MLDRTIIGPSVCIPRLAVSKQIIWIAVIALIVQPVPVGLTWADPAQTTDKKFRWQTA